MISMSNVFFHVPHARPPRIDNARVQLLSQAAATLGVGRKLTKAN